MFKFGSRFARGVRAPTQRRTQLNLDRSMSEPTDRNFSISTNLSALARLVAAQLPSKLAALRELIQNADDALQLREFRDQAFGTASGRITVNADSIARRLSVADNGIGTR